MTTRNQASPLQIKPILTLVAITFVCLVPFINKAFNIDDPLFLWAAKQIQLQPIDFYGFSINWYGHEMAASEIIKNPPLAAYFIALTTHLFGWSETAIHLAFIIPAVAVAAGTYLLAGEFTRDPLSAALIGILNPVFIISSTTVMCDVMMLAFYVWAIFLWIRGMKTDRSWHLFGASLLITLCCLTKYFGVSLIPLLLLFTVLNKEGKRQRALFLLLPIALLCLYQYGTFVLYGKGLLSDAADYATAVRSFSIIKIFLGIVFGLSFSGGCFITVLFLSPLLWSKRLLLVAASIIVVAAFALSRLIGGFGPGGPSWGYFLQLFLFVAAGISIMVLVCGNLKKRKDPESMLLFLWVVGTFAFASVVNWSVNGRSILPMAPAVGIAVIRFLEDLNGNGWKSSFKLLAAPLFCAWLVAMSAAWADYRLADTARAAANAITRTHGSAAKNLWFQGHWGFQYYMEKNGGIAFEREKAAFKVGDLLVIPENNTNIDQRIINKETPLDVLQFPAARYVATMDSRRNVGFYASDFGPLPFLFAATLDEKYHIFALPLSD